MQKLSYHGFKLHNGGVHPNTVLRRWSQTTPEEFRIIMAGLSMSDRQNMAEELVRQGAVDLEGYELAAVA